MKAGDSDWFNRIYAKSCLQMDEIPDGVVDLTVTSPPYWNAIDYDLHSADSSQDYRQRREANYAEYLSFLEKAFSEVLRVHREGGICAVIIGTVLLGGAHTPLPFHFVALMERLGWLFHQDIIWSKCTGGVKRFASTVQHPFPGYYYPNIMTEYILLFRKPGQRRLWEGRSRKERASHRIALDSVTKKEVANNIWHVAPVPPKQIAHPCPFPEEIPYRLIRWFSWKNDLVLDPFCGSGTTLKVAANLGRRWVGYELVSKYAVLAAERVRERLALRKQLVVAYDKVSYGRGIAAKSGKRARFRRKGKAGRKRAVSQPDLPLFAHEGS